MARDDAGDRLLAGLFPDAPQARWLVGPLFQRAEVGIIMVDANLVITFANPRVVRMLGREAAEQLVGNPLLTYVMPACRPLVRECAQDCRKGQVRRYQVNFIRADGSPAQAMLTVFPLMPEKKCSGAIILADDLSETVRQMAELERSKRRYEEFADQIPIAVCEVDADSSILYLNEASRTLFALQAPVKKFRQSLRSFIAPESVGKYDRSIGEVLSGVPVTKRKIDIRATTGDIIPALWNLAPVRCGSARVGARIAILDVKDLLTASLLPDDEDLARYGLSSRERAVARLLISGCLYKEIAAQLGIGIPTVRTYVVGVYRKLGVNSREELQKVTARKVSGFGGDESSILALLRNLR